jgi:protein phosphatase
VKDKNIIVYFAGDTHGDLTISKWIIDHILNPTNKDRKNENKFVFLGDYVDRPPHDVVYGGLKNVLFLLCMKTKYPDNLILLRGNHEGYDLVKLSPYELIDEITVLWGQQNVSEIHNKFIEIFRKLPLFVLTSNGIFAAHGGFPLAKNIFKIGLLDDDAIIQTLWNDPIDYAPFRGPIKFRINYSKEDTLRFLDKINSRVMIRAHHYNTSGYSIYNDRVLTVFTSRRYQYEGAGGVLLVKTELEKNINTVMDLTLLKIEGGKLKKRLIERL